MISDVYVHNCEIMKRIPQDVHTILFPCNHISTPVLEHTFVIHREEGSCTSLRLMTCIHANMHCSELPRRVLLRTPWNPACHMPFLGRELRGGEEMHAPPIPTPSTGHEPDPWCPHDKGAP